MHMSIPREHSPYSDNEKPCMSLDRSAITDACILALRIAHRLYDTDSVPEDMGVPLGELIEALPDEDVAELHYAITEMGVNALALILTRKVNDVVALREQIDDLMGSIEN